MEAGKIAHRESNTHRAFGPANSHTLAWLPRSSLLGKRSTKRHWIIRYRIQATSSLGHGRLRGCPRVQATSPLELSKLRSGVRRLPQGLRRRLGFMTGYRIGKRRYRRSPACTGEGCLTSSRLGRSSCSSSGGRPWAEGSRYLT